MEPSGRTFAESLSVAVRSNAEMDVEADLALIDDAARRFSQSPTPQTFVEFKEAVKAVLAKMLQEAYAVDHIRTFGRHGRQRVQVLVRVIDDHLDQLARLIVQKSNDTVSILHHIEEIKGLLLDAVR